MVQDVALIDYFFIQDSDAACGNCAHCRSCRRKANDGDAKLKDEWTKRAQDTSFIKGGGGLESAVACYRRNESPRSAQDARNRTRVLIVNSHPLTRMGLADLINDQPDLVVCDEAGDSAMALETLKENGSNLVLSELELPDKSGLELIKDIKAIRF